MDSNIFSVLCRLIYDDSALRWEIVKIIKSLSTGPIATLPTIMYFLVIFK